MSSGKQFYCFIKVLWVICHAVIPIVASSALCQRNRETGCLRGKADQYGAGKRDEGPGFERATEWSATPPPTWRPCGSLTC
jgi:hypothetical protein